MPSGEVLLDAAAAWQVGALDQGLKQMLTMVNGSRLSHLARAAGMMRRCLNEALVAARHRDAFGRAVIDHPLMRRQLLKLMVPTEQALSALLLASTLPEGSKALRIMTPIAKFRACRDNVAVATGAMEARGGNGYIEDWPNARLVRDAHLGLLWEGTSNINALDSIQRAVGKDRAHLDLRDALTPRLDGLPGQFRTRLEHGLNDAIRFAEEVADTPENERFSRLATGALYRATTAVLLASETPERLLLSRFVLEHRPGSGPGLSVKGMAWEDEAASLLLGTEPVPPGRARALAMA